MSRRCTPQTPAPPACVAVRTFPAAGRVQGSLRLDDCTFHPTTLPQATGCHGCDRVVSARRSAGLPRHRSGHFHHTRMMVRSRGVTASTPKDRTLAFTPSTSGLDATSMITTTQPCAATLRPALAYYTTPQLTPSDRRVRQHSGPPFTLPDHAFRFSSRRGGEDFHRRASRFAQATPYAPNLRHFGPQPPRISALSNLGHRDRYAYRGPADSWAAMNRLT